MNCFIDLCYSAMDSIEQVEYSNVHKKNRKKTVSFSSCLIVSGKWDSNPRPHSLGKLMLYCTELLPR